MHRHILLSSTGRGLASLSLLALLSACATTPAPKAAPAATSVSAMPTAAPTPAVATAASGTAAAQARPAATPPAPPPAAGAPRPFADVVKEREADRWPVPALAEGRQDLDRDPGQPARQPFFLSINTSRGIGEKMLFAGLMGSPSYTTGGEYVGQFRKAAGNIQLLARNTTFIARPGSPEERAVRKSFSDSLLASAPIASAPHPERKSVLIEAMRCC